MPTVLRPITSGGGDRNESPEALLISAYLEEGDFTPRKHHIEDDHFVAWSQLWSWCMEYQESAGHAPPISLVRKFHPDFIVEPGVSSAWAAEQVRNEAHLRDLRLRAHAFTAASRDGDLDAAFEALEGIQRPRSHRKEPADIFDVSVTNERFDVTRIEVPWATLQRATGGGIMPSELWYIAGRLAHGKSMVMHKFAARAAACGANVGIASLEMPASAVTLRVLAHMANKDKALLAMLRSPEEKERKEATEIIADRIPGSVKVYDPSHGRINTVGSIEEMCHEFDLVQLDHVGLMQNKLGKRAIDDWRVQAEISNSLREINLATTTPMMGAAQVNRQGEHPNSLALPKPSELAQADALAQDATAVIAIKRLSKHVMKYGTIKLREAAGVIWYSNYQPARGDFDEISHERAMDMRAEDEAFSEEG